MFPTEVVEKIKTQVYFILFEIVPFMK